jgi:hypothetical protein
MELTIMAATLQQLPTTFLMNALYCNPSAATFSWNISGQTGPVTRSQVLSELANRSGQGDSSQIVSNQIQPNATNSASTANTKSGAAGVTDKSQLK